MFIYKAKRSFTYQRAACAMMAAVLLFLTAVTPTAAQDVPGRDTDKVWSSAMSGQVCHPAGDASLPVALTGVSARAAVLMEAEGGEVIFGQSPDTRLPMASTTKIMTALVALEELPLDTEVMIPAAAVGVEGSSIYLIEGERLTLEQLLYALLLESANDAAVAIAIAVAGSVEGFAILMNEKAECLGLTDTHFVNPHGLDDENHYTTARELALITREALTHPDFRKICATKRKTIPLHGTEGVRLLLNHNRLLSSYEGCIGVKTGYTKRTGRCLVSAAERDGVTLIAVTLHAPDDWRDHTAMLDHGFALYEAIPLCTPGFFSAPLPTVSGVQDYVIAENKGTLTVTLRRDHGPIRCIVELPRFDFAPVACGQEVGCLRFSLDERDGSVRELGTVPLYAAYTVEEITYRRGLWAWLSSLFRG